ncbi:MAG: hypothetical protein ACM3UU_06695 [Ignavibacteriales bacterium]
MSKFLETILKPNNEKKIRLSIASLSCFISILFIFSIVYIRYPFLPIRAFYLFFFLVLFIPTLLLQVIVLLITRKIKIPPVMQFVLYLLPCIFIMILGHYQPELPQTVNEKSPSLSYSGKYVLTIPIDRNKNYNDNFVWKITIKSKDGKLLYRDENSKFVGHLNVYWIWDSKDNVWLYNSDDGFVYYWTSMNGIWEKKKWGYGKNKQIEANIYPPAELYPYYEK